MRATLKFALASALAGTALASTSALAQQPQWWLQKGFYAGGGLGLGYADFENGDYDAASALNAAAPFATPPQPSTFSQTTSVKKNVTGWKAFAGYRFTPFLALEGAYMGFGQWQYDININQGLAPFGNAQSQLKVQSWNVAGVARLPFQNGISVQAKAGAAYTITKLHAEVTTPNATLNLLVNTSPDSQANKTNFLWGLGAGYDFNERFGVLVEWESIGQVGSANDTGRANVSLFSANAVIKF